MRAGGLRTGTGWLLAVFLLVSACAEIPPVSLGRDVDPGGPLRVKPIETGAVVPDFVAPGLAGGLVRWQDRGDSAAVLVVWASWCPHCGRLLPALGRVSQEFPSVHVLTVTTAIGSRPGPSPAEFLARSHLSFRTAVDDEARSLARALGVYRYPTVYWVGRDGRVRGVTEGEISDPDLRRRFQHLLAASP